MPSEPSATETRKDWDKVQENSTDITERLKVVGGHLYRTIVHKTGAVSMVFVPGN